MLTISSRNDAIAKGMGRREFLRVGAIGVSGLTLADLLRHEAHAGTTARRQKSVIYVVLGGGPSHIDMWDLKPEAPTEYRGPFLPIATRLRAFDNLHRHLERQDVFGGLDRFQAQALEMIASPKVRDAFDLSNEPADVLARYGHKAGKYPHQTVKSILYDWDAKPFLLARRLVEAGVRVVTLRVGSWDHHSGPESDVFYALKLLMPVLDQSLVALANDLKDRGLDQDVLVVVLGEFGRTPKISYPGPGREHWADAGCALFYGGGLKMGQMIGETDSRAERSKSGKISFQNVLATIYRVLGVDLDIKLPDFNGRPQHLLDDREPIRELMA